MTPPWREPSDVVSYRFQKAYPALGQCLRWFSGGLGTGGMWQPLLQTYVRQLSTKQATTLLDEIADALNMGLQDEPELETLAAVLGWSRKWVPGDTRDVLSVLAYLAESLERAA